MKITFFDLTRLSFYGGAERYLKEVGVSLRKKGNTVYGIGDSRSYFAFSILLGVMLAIIPIKDILKRFKQVGQYPSIEPEYKKYINYDRLEMFSLIPFSTHRNKVKSIMEKSDAIFLKNEIADLIYFWLLNIKNKNKYIIAFSSTQYPQIDGIRAKAHNFIYLSRLYKKLIKDIGKVIVSNREDEKLYIREFGLNHDKVFYIPYGLNPEEFAKSKYQYRRMDNKHINLLFVGRLEEQKGIDILSEIINKLSNQPIFSKLHFSIMGDGPWYHYAEELVIKYNNVKWAGAQPRAEVIKAYYNHDLLLVTSRWETFSYVTLEAQFCGLPVIAFDIPGPQDIIDNHRIGTLVPPFNVNQFIRAINNYCCDYHRIVSRRDISREAIKTFSLDKTVDKLIALTC